MNVKIESTCICGMKETPLTRIPVKVFAKVEILDFTFDRMVVTFKNPYLANITETREMPLSIFTEQYLVKPRKV